MANRKIGRGVVRAVGLIASTSTGSIALAQSYSIPTPPVRSPVDENGINLGNGQFTTAENDLSIGPRGDGGLSHSRFWTQNPNGGGWRHSYLLAVTRTGTAKKPGVTISLGDRSVSFTNANFTWTSDQGDGSTLSFDGNLYTYTARDGTIYVFDSNIVANEASYYGRVAAVGTSITRPSGETLTLTYRKDSYEKTICGGSGCDTVTVYVARLQAVSTTAGYQLHYTYFGDDPASADDWYRITSVQTVNNTVSYCDPMLATCPSIVGSTSYSLSTSGTLTLENSTDPAGRTRRYTMDSFRRMVAVKRATSTSDTLLINYDGASRVGTVSNGVATWNYTWSLSGTTLTGTVLQPLSRQRVVASNTTTGNVITDQDALGFVTSFAYDPVGRQMQITVPEGNYITYTYDGRGNVLTQTAVPKSGSGLASIVTSATFDATCANPKTCNQPNTTTDPRGKVTNYTYDSNSGGVTAVTAPAPAAGGLRPETRYAYTPLYASYMNSSGVIAQAPTPIYKLASSSTCQTLAACAGTADEIKSTYAYAPLATGANNLQPTSVSTGPGNGTVTATTAMTYGVVGNLKTVDGPLPGTADTTTYIYNPDRQVEQVNGPDPDGAGPLKNRAARFGFDADGQIVTALVGTVNASGVIAPIQAQITTYDTLGRKVRETLEAVTTYTQTQYSYDDANRLDCVAVRMNAAAFSSPPASACSLGTQGSFGPDRITKYGYDLADQVLKVTTGYGVAGQQRDDVTSTYSANGKLATVADGNGNLTTYIYDGFDRLLQTQLPSKTSVGTSNPADFEQLTYDAASNVTNKLLRNGNNIGYAYDDLNRLTSRTLPASNNNANATFAYDNLGRVRQANNGNPLYTTAVAYGYGFNSLGPVVTETTTLNTGTALTKTSQYDVAGRRTRLTWPDAFYVTYEYDVANEMTAIRENGSMLLATYTYDDLGRRATLARGNGTTTTYSFKVGANDSPWLTSLQLTPVAVGTNYAFTYSPAGEIAQRSSSNDFFAWTAATNANRSYTVNGLNQYATIGGASPSPTYTPRGDLATLNGVTYGYSAESELATANTTRFYYDAAHRMVYIKATPGTQLDYDGSALVTEYNTPGTLIRRYVHGPGVDEPLVWYEGSGTSDRRWLAADERGSIVSITSDTGIALSTNTYDEYGNPGPNNNGRFQYTGQTWISELGMYNYKARIYAPTLGRFLQTDPIGYGDGLNWYNYAGNDPVNKTDPTGTCLLFTLRGDELTAQALFPGPCDPPVGFFPNYDNGGDKSGVRRLAPRPQPKPQPQSPKPNPCQSLGNRIGNALENAGKGVSYSGLTIAGIGAFAGPEGAVPGLFITEVGGVLSTLGQVSQDVAFGRPFGEIAARAAVNAFGARAVNNVVPRSVRSGIGDAIFGQAIGEVASATNASLDPDRCPK